MAGHFLLTPIGTIGDVNPYLGIGSTLRDRGHDVTVLTNPHYESWVRKIGLDYVPLGSADTLRAMQEDPNFWTFGGGWKAVVKPNFLSPMRQAFQEISERYRPGETVVVSPAFGFGARIAQEKLGVPLCTIHTETYCVRSVYDSPLMPPPLVLNRWVPKFVKRAELWVGDRFVVDPLLAGETNTFRAELGLPPVKRFIDRWWHSPQRVIGLYPEWWYPPQPDWHAQIRLTNFPLWDQSTLRDVPEDVREFVEGGEPPIVFTAGWFNIHAKRFYRVAAECAERLGRRGVILTKSEELLPSPLPNCVRRFDYVPFSYLLRHAAALVHHGGTGTMAEGMAAGLPQVVMPMSFSQPDFAARLVAHGCGVAIRPRRFTTDRVSQALEHLLSSQEVADRCRDIAKRIERENTFDQTCDLIEELIGTDGHANGEPVAASLRN